MSLDLEEKNAIINSVQSCYEIADLRAQAQKVHDEYDDGYIRHVVKNYLPRNPDDIWPSVAGELAKAGVKAPLVGVINEVAHLTATARITSQVDLQAFANLSRTFNRTPLPPTLLPL